MIIVADTSPLNYFVLIREIELLPGLFGQVIIPRAVWAELLALGGSHLGRLQSARWRGGVCPRDGEPLERRTIGGRTTFSCPRHQR